jgi:hypothetical protein
MKRVLIYENRKSSKIIYDISAPELENRAFLSLFKVLDEDWQVYSNLDILEEPKKPSMTLEQISQLPEGMAKKAAMGEHKDYASELKHYNSLFAQKKLYILAKKGDIFAAKKLLKSRKESEYEQWDIFDVDN